MSFHIIFVKLYNVLRNKFDYKAIIGKKRKQEKKPHEFKVKEKSMGKSSNDMF